jgi:para-nitrobenzyl esterase
MPAAKGLFHRAVIESGAMLKATSREQASAYSRGFVNKLGISASEVEKLETVPVETILDTQIALAPGALLASPGPCIDGKTLLDHPLNAIRSGASAEVPLLIGTCLTEGTMLHDPVLEQIFALDEVRLVARMSKVFGEKADRLYKQYRQQWPEVTAGELFLLIEAGSGFRRSAIEFADAKQGSGPASVFMYVLEWRSKARNGMVMASHGLEVPLTMDNTEHSGPWTADYPESRGVAAAMSEAWLAFARNGDPNHADLPRWPAYKIDSRSTMLFNVVSRIANDPYREAVIWHEMPESPLILPWG